MNALRWLVFAFAALACSQVRAPSPASTPSEVALLAPAPPPPCIGLPEEPCSYAPHWAPVCQAFAIVHDQQTQLVTAAHCVRSGTARFLAPSGWGHGRAVLLEQRGDVALLALEEPDQFAPLRIGRLPLVGDAVHSGDNAGRVMAWLGPELFETSQTVAPGWSGAPVLDARGDVVGVVSRCHADDGFCLAHHTIVSALPRGSF